MVTKKDLERIDYIHKRIEHLHKSFTRKMAIFTIVIINTYLLKLWVWYISIIEQSIKKLDSFLQQFIIYINENSGIGIILNDIGFTTFLSNVYYIVAYGFTSIFILGAFYICSYDIFSINKLKKELKKYDIKYSIEVLDFEKSGLVQFINRIFNKV